MMSQFMRLETDVLIVGACPDRVNNNSILRGFVKEGFDDVLGNGFALECDFETAIDQINVSKPKLVLVFGSCMPDVCYYLPLRIACEKIGSMLSFWLHDDPYEFDFGYRVTELADWIFSNDSWATIHYNHPKVHFLPMAASPKAHLREWRDEKSNDVFFCGVAFPNRIALLKDLSLYLSNHRTSIMGGGWPEELSFAKNQRLTNMQWGNACANSHITLNIGRTMNLANKRYQLDAATPGPRTFEAALAGSVQMMYVDGLGITDFFEPNNEIILFDDPKDFNDLLNELLSNRVRSRAIAEAARTRALRDHTYAARAKKIIDIVGLAARQN